MMENICVGLLNLAIKEAEINGFEVIHSNIDRLLLDLDDEQALKTYEKVLPVVAVQLELKELDRWKSKSGTGTHVNITM